MNTPSKPTHNACINIDSKWHQIGVAWLNEDGAMRIVFNAFLHLPVTAATSITCFINKEKELRVK